MRFGKYELGDLIARGGMAEVYSARLHGAEGFVRSVAIKRIREHFTADPEFVRLFIAEARLVAQLHHGNIVQIHDFDAVDGAYYLAMERVEGHDLRRVLARALERGRRLSPALGLHVAVEVAKGLMAAHERCADDGRPLGIVHRDLSPHNILVSYAGEVKVTDFGIAKAVSAAAGHDTGSDVVRGKVPYMSPEQVRGEEVDQRSDLFALGLVLFELTTGRRRYGGGPGDGLLLRVAEAELPNPAEHNAAISPGLNAVIRRLLAPRPADRYASAREVLQALRERGGAVDRSLELAAFMQALYPAEAEASRRGGGFGSTSADGAAPPGPPPDGGVVGGTDGEPSDPTGLAVAVTAAGGGAATWRPWLLGAAGLVIAGTVALLATGRIGAGGGASGGVPEAAPGGAPATAQATTEPSPRVGATGRALPAAVGLARRAAAGALEISSDPPGAAVLVDGLPTGRRTPARLGVVPGTHRITVRWDDDAERRTAAEVGAGERRRLHLVRPPGPRRYASRSRARPVPRPAPRPQSARPAPAPRGGPAPTRPVEVAIGRQSRVQFTCRPWAMVTVEGKDLGQTPVGRSLAPGTYRVVFRNPSLDRRKAVTLQVRGDGSPRRVDCQF